MFKKLVVLSMCLTAFGSFAGSESGGGQGGFCINSVCKTLAEAGIRIAADSKDQGRWHVPQSVLNELDKITLVLPYGRRGFQELALGEVSTFTKVESVSKSLLRKVEKDYRKVLKETKNSSREKELKIFAISTDKSTFLLPEFFALSDYQKALVLVHEGVVRNFNQDFKLALEFDGELIDYLANRNNPEYSPINFLRLLGTLSEEKSSAPAIAATKVIERQLGRRLSLSDLVGPYIPLYSGQKLQEIGMAEMARAQSMAPNFLEVFGKAYISKAEIYSFNHRDQRALFDACAPSGLKNYVRIDDRDFLFLDCTTLKREEISGVRIILKNVNGVDFN